MSHPTSHFIAHPPVHFTLYSRAYCHLCDDMHQALMALHGEYAFTITVLDVDADPGLVEQYDELVPVLLGSQQGTPAIELCHYFLDVAKVRTFLDGQQNIA